jgi:glucokinase
MEALDMKHDGLQETVSTVDRECADDGRRFVAGIDIGGTNLRVALADDAGKIVGKWAGLTTATRDGEMAVQRMCEGIDRLLAEQGSTRECLMAAAAGVPGVTDVDNGTVLATSYLMGWKDLPLRSLLQSALGVPVMIDNDVNMAAIGEARAGVARGVSNFVFVGIGTGLGAGVVVNNQLVRGDSWRAGEIGYMMVPGTSETPVELDEPGGLEELVGGEGIRAQWRKVCAARNSQHSPELNATQIFDLAVERDSSALEVLETASRTMAYAACNIAMLLDCRLLVLGGTVGLHPAFVEAIRAHLVKQGMRMQIEVETSSLGVEAQIVGAVFAALDLAKTHASAPKPSLDQIVAEFVSGSANNG